MTETIYAVTRYRELGEGRFEALTKHDVTHDFYEILDAINGADKSHLAMTKTSAFLDAICGERPPGRDDDIYCCGLSPDHGGWHEAYYGPGENLRWSAPPTLAKAD